MNRELREVRATMRGPFPNIDSAINAAHHALLINKRLHRVRAPRWWVTAVYRSRATRQELVVRLTRERGRWYLHSIKAAVLTCPPDAPSAPMPEPLIEKAFAAYGAGLPLESVNATLPAGDQWFYFTFASDRDGGLILLNCEEQNYA